MRVVVFDSSKKRESRIMRKFVSGILASGDQAELIPVGGQISDLPDAAMIFGVKSLKHWRAMKDLGIRTIYGDKGYSRADGGWRYLRFCWDDTQPVQYVATARHSIDRFMKLGLPIASWRRRGLHVLFAGSSAKYNRWHGLPHPTEYAKTVVEQIAAVTNRPILYRVKPSWRGKEPISGTKYSPGTRLIEEDLRGAHCLVTHGSNAGVDALLAGVPVVALGEGAVFRCISSKRIEDVVEAPPPTDAERVQFLANLAWCQWTEEEIASGEAWRELRSRA